MSFIYPKCPSCGEKASKGEGLGLSKASRHRFMWKCSSCGKVHIGTFRGFGVGWKEEDIGLLRRIKYKIFRQ